jgi:hypothetical protein
VAAFLFITFHEAMAGRRYLVYRVEQYTALIEFGFHRLLCRVTSSQLIDAGYCPDDRGLIVRRPFSYGWQVHQLRLPGG